MNKEEVIKRLSEITKIDYDTCLKINDILEDNAFIFGNKDSCVNDLINKLGFDKNKATSIYDSAKKLIGDGIIDKLHHPFKDQD